MNKRKEKLRAQMGAFMQQYVRRSQRGKEPNDRSYNRDIEAKIKRMKPEERKRNSGYHLDVSMT